eukprot:gnl/Chilomastix_caulleri/1131.p2 GENE.gnl/Chilomastix_caulleri/1131~~gnl/Chilomastix_caulleri/1131.p2  ORF type:complete len:178 (-),score=67.32 gnl/Chilomastix_caulleri/1131:400-933(-)
MDVAKMVRRFANKGQSTYSLSPNSPTFSMRYTHACPSPCMSTSVSMGEEPRRNVVELRGCGLELFVDNVEEAVEKAASLFRLKRAKGEAGTSTVTLVDGTSITFRNRESGRVYPEYSITLRYNSEASVKEIKKEMEGGNMASAIEVGVGVGEVKEVGDGCAGFCCKLFGVRWVVRSD